MVIVESGDWVTFEAVSGGPANLPGPNFHVPPEPCRICETPQNVLLTSHNLIEMQSGGCPIGVTSTDFWARATAELSQNARSASLPELARRVLRLN